MITNARLRSTSTRFIIWGNGQVIANNCTSRSPQSFIIRKSYFLLLTNLQPQHHMIMPIVHLSII